MRIVGRDAEVPGEVLIITGPAAAGKTTVARRLAEESVQPSVHLHADDFFAALKTGRRRGWESGAEPQHEVVFAAVGAAAAVYAAGGYFVVLDTLVRRAFLDALISPILDAGVALSLIVLRPDFDAVRARTQARDPRARHTDDVLRWLYDAFADLGELERHVIDNTFHADPEETVASVLARRSTGGARLLATEGLRRTRHG